MIQRLVALVCAGLLFLSTVVGAQGLGPVAVDFVRADGGGTHRIIVSAFDPAGRPLGDLDHAFRVTLDGQPVDRLLARPVSAAYRGTRVTVVVDAALLQKATLDGVQDGLRRLAASLDGRDELRVVSAGRKVHARVSDKAGAEELIRGLGEWADAETPLLYDALQEATRASARLADDRGAIVLLVTRGGDGGSDHSLLEVFAL